MELFRASGFKVFTLAILATLSGAIVRADPAGLQPLRTGTLHRVRLFGDQQLTGELLGLDEKGLRLRTAWTDQILIPRNALVGVEQMPGWITYHDDDFEKDLTGWKLTDQPSLSDKQKTSGQRSLLLNAPGQSAEFTLSVKSVPAPKAQASQTSRAGINFYDPGNTAGTRWLVEAEFVRSEVVANIKVVVAGDSEKYTVESSSKPDKVREEKRTAGWHRLEFRFSRDYALVGVDDALLASWKEGGSLRRFRISCVALPGNTIPRGEVFFDDFSLARGVEVLPHRVEDASQDELWLVSGDQLFGRFLRADRRTIQWRGEFGDRTFAWGEVRGIFPRREVPPVQTTEGEHVRIALRSGAGAATDHLDGVLMDLNDKQVTLQHSLLGKLEIERGRLDRLDRQFRGERIELDNAPHHLGEKGKLAPGLDPLRAEGTSLRQSFRLNALPKEARLVIRVERIDESRDRNAAVKPNGNPSIEIKVNGQKMDLQASPGSMMRLTVLVQHLLVGDNVLEIGQLRDLSAKRASHHLVTRLVLELPRQ